MRLMLLTGFLFLASLAYSQQNSIDVLHYKFHIGLKDNNDTIYGKAEITISKPILFWSFEIDLAGLNPQGKGMIIDTLKRTLWGSTIIFPLNSSAPFKDTLSPPFFKHIANKVLIRYGGHRGDHALRGLKDTSIITIYYHGIPADGLIISKTKYGRRSFFADNWPDRGHNWLPCNDNPADKASVEFIVTAPEHYQVVANGIQVEETSYGNSNKLTHWKEDIPISTKIMTIGVADFAVRLAGFVNGCIPVYSWVYPEDRDKGFYDFELAKDILPFFINHVGPYGYKKLANVQSKTRFGGLENANTIFYSENSVTGTRKNEGLLVHEIAHQWFGNIATEKSFGHLWLSEGFATYFTVLYFENKYGKDTAIKMLANNREQVIAYSKRSNTPVVDTAQKEYMKLLNANSYQKGGWVLHMLRRELGDSIFWKSIRKYYATYSGTIAGTEDLRKVFEEISRKDLKQFFHQWLYSTGQPDLDINWSYHSGQKEVTVNIIQKQKELFYFPLTLLLRFSSGATLTRKLIIDRQSKTFTFSLGEKPTGILADPETSLLFNGKPVEIK